MKVLRSKKRSRLVIPLSILLVALVAIPVRTVHGQDDASISGDVLDSSGAGIEGAKVLVKNLETGTQRELVTDPAGRFHAPSLPVGSYEVTAEKDGFRAEQRKGIVLVVGQREELHLVLKVGDVRQTVEVTSDPGLLSATTEDTSGLVNERQVKDLPLNGRSYDQLLTLNPGTINYTSQRAGGTGTSNSVLGNMFAVSGRRPQENLFLLNGVEYTGASEINTTPGGTSGQLIGVDAVREFEVVKDSYGAEYGKRPGAQVSIVTANGTNQFHGSVYEFVRNSAMDARNFFDQANIPPFQRNVFGGSAGGPILKDKTFVFGNYEGYRQTLGLSDVTLVPDNASRAAGVSSIQPLLALWPVANGPELLTFAGKPSGIAFAYSNPIQNIREDFGTTRLDQFLSSKDNFAAVYTIDDSQAHSPTSNPITLDDLTLRAQVASLSETHVFSSSLVNKGTFGFSRAAFFFDSDTTVSLPSWIHDGQPVGAVVVGGGTTLNGASQITNGGTNAGSNLRAVRNLFTVDDQLSYSLGRQTLSFGGWLQRLQSNDSLVQDQYGQVSFTNLQTFLAGNVSTYTYAPHYTPLGWRSLEGAFFIEDVIKLKSNLEVRVGFRGEMTNGWNEAQGRASNYLFNASGVILTQPDVGGSALAVNNATFLPAPRVGIAWAPGGSRKTVIRAGFGTYYALLDNLSYRLDQNGPFNTVYAVKNIPFSSISPDSTYTGAKVIPSGVQPNLQIPTVESWSLKVERELVAKITLGVGYVGSHGYHELLSLDANLPTGGVICPASPCPADYPAGTFYYAPGLPLANNAVWNTTHWFSEGVSSYNGLELDVNRSWSNGLQFRGVYTFSKTLDDGDNMNTSVATNSPAFVANPLNPQADYGRASFDVRNSGVVQAIYELPFARDSASPSLWETLLVKGWQASTIVTVQSGLPFTPQLSYNPSNDGDTRNPVRPSWNPNFSGKVVLGLPNEYFNPLAFIQPLPGTYGNVGRNVLQGPSLAQVDISLAKRWALSERIGLQFRGEIFNLFNRVNLNTPNPVVYAAATGEPSPTAGVITSTATTSRQTQLGLKLTW